MAAAKKKANRAKRNGRKQRKARKRHVQQPLFRRGGRRRGAGRKSKKARPGRRHARRADFSARHPLHVVLRVEPIVGTLRRRAMYKAIREATRTVALKQRMRIVHVSLQRTHLHMLVEAGDRKALARGMQGFEISAARHINTVLGKERARVEASCSRGASRATRRVARRCGRVFADRYYVEVITTPTQAHHAIRYVLLNWRKHGEDRQASASTSLVDPFSTGARFPGWLERQGARGSAVIRESDEPLFVSTPMTWLLSDGWRRAGSISAREVPASGVHTR